MENMFIYITYPPTLSTTKHSTMDPSITFDTFLPFLNKHRFIYEMFLLTYL